LGKAHGNRFIIAKETAELEEWRGSEEAGKPDGWATHRMVDDPSSEKSTT
jgi:hypothetical protein